jgi:hypothetical protein
MRWGSSFFYHAAWLAPRPGLRAPAPGLRANAPVVDVLLIFIVSFEFKGPVKHRIVTAMEVV